MVKARPAPADRALWRGRTPYSNREPPSPFVARHLRDWPARPEARAEFLDWLRSLSTQEIVDYAKAVLGDEGVDEKGGGADGD